ncbi:MAG: MATE family efflux transporter [Bacteroidetes bacterium]|nr:MATE family efflux transporter [Bacteroidota bacterium]
MLLSEIYRNKAREALRLALPIIIGQLGQVLMGFFDIIQIGGLGQEYIAGGGFANSIYWMTNLLGMGILFAISTLVSEVYGEKQNWKAMAVYRSGIKVALVLSVLFTGAMMLITTNIHWFGQDKVVDQIATRYLNIVNYSTIFVFLFTACKQLLDGMGRTKVGMVVTIGGLILNVFLNWIFIYGNLGVPRLEIEGAAIATTISRVLMVIAFLSFIQWDKQLGQLRNEYKETVAEGISYIRMILKIGIPAGLQFFWEVAAFGGAQIMSGWLGVKYEAAHLIAIGLASITFMILTGISAAGSILAGFAYGARNREEIRIAGNTAFMLTIAIEILFAILFLSGARFLPTLYTDDTEVIALASSMLLFAAFFQISDGLQAVAAGVLRGVQDVKIPAVIAFVSYWMIMLPTCYLLTFTFGLGLKGIWIGFIVGLSVTAVMQISRFKWMVPRIKFEEV